MASFTLKGVDGGADMAKTIALDDRAEYRAKCRAVVDGEVKGAKKHFSKLNLSGADLSGLNLDGASFVGSDLFGACFAGASLIGADFSGALLVHTNFRDADITDAIFDGATIKGDNRAAAAKGGGK